MKTLLENLPNGISVNIIAERKDDNTYRVSILPKTKDSSINKKITPFSGTGTSEEIEEAIKMIFSGGIKTTSMIAQAKQKFEAEQKKIKEDSEKQEAKKKKAKTSKKAEPKKEENTLF